MSERHEHVTIDEIQRYYAALAGGINGKNAGFVRYMLAQFERCNECSAREEFFSRVSTAFAEEIGAFQAQSEYSAEPVGELMSTGLSALEDVSVSEVSAQPLFERAVAFVDSAGKVISDKAKSVISDWVSGLRLVVSPSQVRLVPVGARSRGLSITSGARGAKEKATMIVAVDTNEDTFEFNLVEQQELFINIDIDEGMSPRGKYTAVILHDGDQSAPIALDFDLNVRKDSLLTNQVTLEPGHYYCVILADDKA